ncbi:hypothetical protein ACX93W_01795 [Paenibacillus sp. CAU 1782]
MKHAFIAEITIKQPFDEELEGAYADASDEKRAEVTESMRQAFAEWAGETVEGDGDVAVSVRIEEVSPD